MRFRTIIVEDDPMVASINRQYLNKNPLFELISMFENGLDALQFCMEHPVDLAIIDNYMPVMDGKEFISRCRKQGLSMDIIMITAANRSEDIRDVLDQGAVDYLIKPFTYERFQSALERYAERQTALREGSKLSQTDIDRLLAAKPAKAEKQEPLEKGLQQQTLDTILEYLSAHRDTYMRSEVVAKEIGLSRSTVRRYMGHLLEEEIIESRIDYGTGGRPSIEYRLREQG
jgi:CitB family two-component system response regulator MalR/two-component system response regulator DctR